MRDAPISPAGQSAALSDVRIDAGLTFVEILKAQRAARSAVDSGTAGEGAAPWCEDVPNLYTQPAVAPAEGDRLDAERSGEVSYGDARRRTKPRMVGQGMLEYALVVILVAIVVIVLLGTVGHQAQDVFSNLSHGLAT